MKLDFNRSKIIDTREYSLQVLNDLKYIDSLDDEQRAHNLKVWFDGYLHNTDFKFSDLELDELLQFQELFYRNISFLKKYRAYIKEELDKNEKLRKFFN